MFDYYHTSPCGARHDILSVSPKSILVLVLHTADAMRAPGCKNWPAPFPGRMSYKTTKPGLALSYILACLIVLLFIRAPFYVLLVFVAMCSVFWLFWLSCHYLLSDWLERSFWGSLIVARGSSPESPGRRVRIIFFVYCIASLFYYVFVLSPAPAWYIILLLWCNIAYLCWKCC